MKPFNLDAAKNGDPIITLDGRVAHFIAHVPEAGRGQQVVCRVEEKVLVYSTEGLVYSDYAYQRSSPSELDLGMAAFAMRSIGEYEFPEPTKELPKKGREYFVAEPSNENLVFGAFWKGTDQEIILLRRGMVHLFRNHAKAHSLAMIKASGGSNG